ncbi:MAG: hypothetical protein GY756_11680, partial [bacterium]|nr:hypothetical protein [bacterium]
LIGGYLYRNELFSTHKKQVKSLNVYNKGKTELLYTQIQSLNKQLDDQSKLHDKMTTNVKESYKQATDYANKRVEILTKEINVLTKEKTLLEQEKIPINKKE